MAQQLTTLQCMEIDIESLRGFWSITHMTTSMIDTMGIMAVEGYAVAVCLTRH